MKAIKENFVKSIHSDTKYWNHAQIHGKRSADGIVEHSRANPDVLDESMDMYAVQEAEKEVQERVQRLLGIAKQILTDMQYRVFVLLAVKDPALTEREAAKVLSISRGRVHQLWEVAREKLQKAYEGRTRD